MRVLDATIVNGTPGYADAAKLAPEAGSGALIVSATPWVGGATAAPLAPAQVDFVHFEKPDEAEKRASEGPAVLPEVQGNVGGNEGGTASKGDCVEAPTLTISKQVEFDGTIANRLEIDTTDLDGPDVELVWHLTIVNGSRCAKVHKLRVLDNLPAGFIADEVEARQDGPSASAVITGLVCGVFPVFGVLAHNDYGFTSFDDSGWRVAQARGVGTFIFEATMARSPFAPGRHIHLAIHGRQLLPPRKGRSK